MVKTSPGCADCITLAICVAEETKNSAASAHNRIVAATAIARNAKAMRHIRRPMVVFVRLFTFVTTGRYGPSI
jgi:hypothetical protein